MNENKQQNEMATGSIPKLFFKLAIPAVVAQIVNLLYNIVDRIYIGHIPEVGAAALTGVGLCAAIMMFITAFSMLAGAGGAPRAALYYFCCNLNRCYLHICSNTTYYVWCK